MMTALRSRRDRRRDLPEHTGTPQRVPQADTLLHNAFRHLEEDLHRFLHAIDAAQPPAMPVLQDRDDAWVWHVDVPEGLRRRHLTVEVAGDRVVAEGRREPRRLRRGDARRSWRAEMRLPAAVDEGDVRATLRGGQLEVAVPKPSQLRRRRVPVLAGGSGGRARLDG